jgi:uncharacterized surface protein with fasciclin (FAS1) repeats
MRRAVGAEIDRLDADGPEPRTVDSDDENSGKIAASACARGADRSAPARRGRFRCRNRGTPGRAAKFSCVRTRGRGNERSMKFLVASSLVALSALIPASALAGDTCSTQTLAATHGQKQDIVATAIGAGSFQTLVAAVQAAGLVDTLKGKGPFTVFAPSDEAFAKLPKGTLESLLKPENRQQLVDILTYHVVPAEVTSAAAMKDDFAQTVLGQALRVEKLDIADGKTVLRIDGATVTAADIACSNGVIHVIDTVLLPRKNLVETAKAAGTFRTLLAAAQAAGLVDALSGKEPLTVFAPSDEAFAKLPAGTVESLLKPENKEKLAAVLKYHVVAGRHLAKDVVTLKEVATLNGKHAAIRVDGSGAHIAGAKIVATDVLAANGVIHVIDTVMLP